MFSLKIWTNTEWSSIIVQVNPFFPSNGLIKCHLKNKMTATWRLGLTEQQFLPAIIFNAVCGRWVDYSAAPPPLLHAHYLLWTAVTQLTAPTRENNNCSIILFRVAGAADRLLRSGSAGRHDADVGDSRDGGSDSLCLKVTSYYRNRRVGETNVVHQLEDWHQHGITLWPLCSSSWLLFVAPGRAGSVRGNLRI